MSKNLLKTEDLPKPNSILVLSRIALQLKEMNAEFEIKADGVIIKSGKHEDEKIRKRIIHALHGDVLDMEETNEALAWLERQGEQKQEWSEEDDYNLQCMIAKVTSDIQKGNVGRNNELIDWLKSLKDRMKGKEE